MATSQNSKGDLAYVFALPSINFLHLAAQSSADVAHDSEVDSTALGK